MSTAASTRIFVVLAMIVPLSACSQRGDPNDPAYGGFFKGIENINDGTYDARIATKEEKVAALEARQQRLLAERNSLGRQITSQENALARMKHDLLVTKLQVGEENIPPETLANVNSALAAQPTGNSDQERLKNLQKTRLSLQIVCVHGMFFFKSEG